MFVVYWSNPMLQHNSKVKSPIELYRIIFVAISYMHFWRARDRWDFLVINWFFHEMCGMLHHFIRATLSSKLKSSYLNMTYHVSLEIFIDSICNVIFMFINDIFISQPMPYSYFYAGKSPLWTKGAIIIIYEIIYLNMNL